MADSLTGGLASTVFDAVKTYFPPDMSEEQKAAVGLELEKIELQKTAEVNKAIAEAETRINERIAMHEGTAKDLKTLPIVGRLIIFARGCQRPLWGFATMYADLMWFSGDWANMTEKQESALFMINLLVLGFLFGERAVQNVTPLLSQYFGKK